MNVKILSAVIVVATILLLAQTVSIVDGHHKTKDNGEIRKSAEEKSEPYDKQGNLKTTIEDKKKAFKEYKIAFDAWKTAKEAYKVAKTSGDMTAIDAKKVILDTAEITKDNALKKYLDAKKKRSR